MISGAGGTAACTSASTANGASIDGITLSNLTNHAADQYAARTYIDYTALTPANLPVGRDDSHSPSHTAAATAPIIPGSFPYISTLTMTERSRPMNWPLPECGRAGWHIHRRRSPCPTTAVVGSCARCGSSRKKPAIRRPFRLAAPMPPARPRTTGSHLPIPRPTSGSPIWNIPACTTCPNDSTLVAVRIHNYGTVTKGRSRSLPSSRRVGMSSQHTAPLAATVSRRTAMWFSPIAGQPPADTGRQLYIHQLYFAEQRRQYGQ